MDVSAADAGSVPSPCSDVSVLVAHGQLTSLKDFVVRQIVWRGMSGKAGAEEKSAVLLAACLEQLAGVVARPCRVASTRWWRC